MLPERIAPDEIGEGRIAVRLADVDAVLSAHVAIVLAIDYTACLPSGVVLPLVFSVSSGRSVSSFQKRIFTRAAPTSIVWTPVEGGPHLVRVAEVFHNRWQGVLRLDIAGERLFVGTL